MTPDDSHELSKLTNEERSFFVGFVRSWDSRFGVTAREIKPWKTKRIVGGGESGLDLRALAREPSFMRSSSVPRLNRSLPHTRGAAGLTLQKTGAFGARIFLTKEQLGRALATLDVVFPVVTGLAVVLVTFVGDRVGGRLGGLLATAPVTTTGAHILIAASVPPEQAAGRILEAIAALLASTFGIVAFFYAVKYTRGRSSNARLAVGLGAYLALFLPLTLLLAQSGIPPISGFVILLVIHVALAFSFMREPVPVLQDYVMRRAPRTAREFVLRFLAGALVVTAIRFLVQVSPPLAGALAVVPAVFLVSLTVMGVRQNAPFAARAAQAGLFGTTAVAFFVLVIAGVLALGYSVWWAIIPAWAAYGGTLTLLSLIHRRIAR